MKRAIILTDGKAGHENQSRALARGLGCEVLVRKVAFKSPFAKALSYALDHLGILAESLFTDGPHVFSQPPEKIDLVIGTGSGTFYAAKCLAQRLGAKSAVVLYPRGYVMRGFDAILAPIFDNPKKAENVFPIAANLVASDAAFYEAGIKAFRAHYDSTTNHPLADKPLAVAVIVGGPNACSTMDAAWMKAQLESVQSLVRAKSAQDGCRRELWVTTSRRTPHDVEQVIDKAAWDYKLLYSKDHFNPVPAFVALADELYVSAESTGMLSEACTAGHASVHALDNLKPGPHKFRRFVELLRQNGYVDGTRKINPAATFEQVKNCLWPSAGC